jgi:hypothetical protein
MKGCVLRSGKLTTTVASLICADGHHQRGSLRERAMVVHENDATGFGNAREALKGDAVAVDDDDMGVGGRDLAAGHRHPFNSVPSERGGAVLRVANRVDSSAAQRDRDSGCPADVAKPGPPPRVCDHCHSPAHDRIVPATG